MHTYIHKFITHNTVKQSLRHQYSSCIISVCSSACCQ